MRIVLAAVLGWLLPGLGHIFIGERTRGIVFLVVICLTYWSGVAIGGVRSVVNPQEHKLWFMAQMCTGGNTLAAVGLGKVAPDRHDDDGNLIPPVDHWIGVDVGIHYTGVAGLLNLLVILDVILRADPVHLRKLAQSAQPGGGP